MFEKLKLPIITDKDLENQFKIALFNFFNPSRHQAILEKSSELLKSISNDILDNIDLDRIFLVDFYINDKGEVFLK